MSNEWELPFAWLLAQQFPHHFGRPVPTAGAVQSLGVERGEPMHWFFVLASSPPSWPCATKTLVRLAPSCSRPSTLLGRSRMTPPTGPLIRASASNSVQRRSMSLKVKVQTPVGTGSQKEAISPAVWMRKPLGDWGATFGRMQWFGQAQTSSRNCCSSVEPHDRTSPTG
jgi:hypothetical protein